MEEAQRLLTVSVWKLYRCRVRRGGLRLHRSLQLSLLVRAARHRYLSARAAAGTPPGADTACGETPARGDLPLDTTGCSSNRPSGDPRTSPARGDPPMDTTGCSSNRPSGDPRTARNPPRDPSLDPRTAPARGDPPMDTSSAPRSALGRENPPNRPIGNPPSAPTGDPRGAWDPLNRPRGNPLNRPSGDPHTDQKQGDPPRNTTEHTRSAPNRGDLPMDTTGDPRTPQTPDPANRDPAPDSPSRYRDPPSAPRLPPPRDPPSAALEVPRSPGVPRAGRKRRSGGSAGPVPGPVPTKRARLEAEEPPGPPGRCSGLPTAAFGVLVRAIGAC